MGRPLHRTESRPHTVEILTELGRGDQIDALVDAGAIGTPASPPAD